MADYEDPFKNPTININNEANQEKPLKFSASKKYLNKLMDGAQNTIDTNDEIEENKDVIRDQIGNLEIGQERETLVFLETFIPDNKNKNNYNSWRKAIFEISKESNISNPNFSKDNIGEILNKEAERKMEKETKDNEDYGSSLFQDASNDIFFGTGKVALQLIEGHIENLNIFEKAEREGIKFDQKRGDKTRVEDHRKQLEKIIQDLAQYRRMRDSIYKMNGL